MVISKKKEERRGGKDAVKEGFKKIKKGAKFLWFFFSFDKSWTIFVGFFFFFVCLVYTLYNYMYTEGNIV